MIIIDTLFFTVINRGKADSVLRKAKECGATSGTIFLGEGTVQSRFLELIGLTEIHKEILMISATNELSDKLHETIGEAFQFHKKNKGIAFSVPFMQWELHDDSDEEEANLSDVTTPYCCIITIVDKGRSKDCIASARAAGARGGTLIHGHGAGVPTDYYFPLVIEPQKDTVMIVTTTDKAPSIRERIFHDLELDKPGNGIVFTLPVTKTSGLYENRTEERKGVTA